MKKAIIYLRVSTEDQAEKGFSIYAQREECIKKAQELGCEDVIECVDEGVSGSILERPMLMNAIESLKNEKIGYFICFDSSRLSRNVAHQLILIDTIKKHEARLVFVRNSFEDTAEGRFQITIMAAVDEYERAKLKIRTELGKRSKAKLKKLTHNPGLYGYDFDEINDVLKINETQAQVVKMMYGWLLEECIGPAEIASKLNAMQILSMRGKQWSRVSVNRILHNFSYTGTLYIRRYDTRDYKLNKYKRKEEKIKIKEKPKEQWMPIEIPAIIDLDTWQRASNQLEKAKRAYKKGAKKQYLLSGLLRCAECGGTLFGRSSSKNGNVLNKYYCCVNKYNYNKDKEDRCKSKLYKADELEAAVWNTIKDRLLNEKEIKKILDEKESFSHKDNDEKILKRLLIQKEEEKERLLTIYQKGIIDETELKNRLKNIAKAIENILCELRQISILKNNDGKIQKDDIIDKLDSYLESQNTSNKNKLLHIIIKEIILGGDLVNIRTLIPDHI